MYRAIKEVNGMIYMAFTVRSMVIDLPYTGHCNEYRVWKVDMNSINSVKNVLIYFACK